MVRQFLIDQLRYNDNTANPYSDGFYICSIISAAACAVVSTAPPERGELLPSETHVEQNAEDVDLVKQIRTEVDRYRSMDRLIPSPHNIVTTAALEFYALLGVSNLIPSHPRIFFPLTREGNYTQVRIAAFDGLFLTKWYTPQIMRYILAVMANDSSRVIRRHVARNACYSLALLVQMGEMKSNLKETESLLIEEDGNGQEKAKESKKSEMDAMIKALRKDREVGKNEVLREFLMPIALMPDIDHEVRWCILKLADLLIRPVEETPPTVKIHIPSTPVTEVAPQLPLPKMPAKIPRVIKSGGPPTKGPSIAVAPKLRLTNSPLPDAIPRVSITPIVDAPKKNVAFVAPMGPPVTKPPKLKGKSTKSVDTYKVAPQVPKVAHVPKAQSGGMSLNDLRACRNALKKLRSNKHATLFLQPVDPIRDHAPNYFDIIKDPMDLSTMGAKLEEGMYKDRFAFQADFRLMVNNSKTYNTAGSFVHNEAIALETTFEKQWAIINKTLEAADKAHPPQVSQPVKPQPRTLPPVPKSFPSRPVPASAPEKGKASSVPDSVPVASTSRPIIKLKVGSQSKPVETPSESVPKVRVKKPKPLESSTSVTPVIDAPPPPYVDDGSHDILQEVLAIEREKDEQRHRLVVEKDKDKPTVNGASGKRKKPDIVDEDDILALTKPAKKERPSPSGPSSTSSKAEAQGPVPPSTKAASGMQRPKKEKVEASRPPKAESPRISLKGKEKEVAPPTQALPPSTTPTPVQTKTKKPPVVQATPLNDKKCKDLLRALAKVPEAAIFMHPVDPIRDGCPTYLDEIEHPMDFGTVTTNLINGEYETMEDFKKDIELVFSNCRQFNPPATFPVDCANAVEKVFKKEWPKAMERKLSWSDKRGLQGILTTLVKEPISWIYREPVDPVALGIPTYHDVIPRKNARDLRTIRQKLDIDKYDTVEAVEADLELMVQNSITFNGVDSEVGPIALNIRQRIQELFSLWRSGPTKKRKETEQGTGQPLKKIKTG